MGHLLTVDISPVMPKLIHAVKPLVLSLAAASGMLWGEAVAMSQTYQPNEMVDSVRVNGHIFMLRSNARRGNPNAAASIGEDGVLLVDTSFATYGAKLRAKITELGGRDVKFIINTHWHGDHTGGNESFGPSAAIISRPNTRKRLLTQNILDDSGSRLLAKQGLPTITLDHDISLFFNGEEIKVIATPTGHTDGDVLVYFTGSKVLCVGDYFFADRFPVIDVEESGADLKGYLNRIRHIIDNYPADVKIISGHSGFYPAPLKVSSMRDYENYYAMLTESVEFVSRKVRAGMSLEQLQKEGLPEKFRMYDERPRFVSAAKWIETIYLSLQTKQL